MYISPSPPPCYFFSPGLFLGMENNFGAPRGVRAWMWRWPLEPSCQKRGEAGRGGCKRRGKGANFIPTAANRGVAFLFGHSPVSVPFDQFLLPNRRCGGHPLLFSLSPFLLLCARRRGPRAPRSYPPGSSAHHWGKGEGSRGNPRGQKLGKKTCWAKRQKVARSWEKKSLVAACFVPAQTPARGKGFLPLALVWAAGLELKTEGDCSLRVRPRGKPSHQSVICG